MYAKGGKVKKGDVGKSGTQYGYTLKEWEQNAKKRGLLVSPTQWWKSQEGRSYTDSFGRKKIVGHHSGDERQSMNMYGYLIANGLDLGSKIIPESAIKYVKENDYMKYAQGGDINTQLSKYKLPLSPFLVEIKPFNKKEKPIVVRVSPDSYSMHTAGYTIYENEHSKRKVGYLKKHELLTLLENGDYKILKNSKMAQGGDIESIKMDMDLIKKQYPKAKVSYFFAKNPNGKNYVIVARENNKIVYSSYHNKYAQGGEIETTFTYQIGGL
jgi:hypothetical protein